MSPENKEKLRIANTGKIITDETRQKLIDSHLGYKATDETKIKMSNSHLGQNTWSKGTTVSEEIREKESKARRGKPRKKRNIKFIGVYISGKKYRGQLGNKHLGTFFTIEEAARAYDKAFKEHYNVNVGINFPNE